MSVSPQRLAPLFLLLLITIASTPTPTPALADLRQDDIGGDDIIVCPWGDIETPALAIAENGDVFVAFTFTDPDTDDEIHVYRSTDGGLNFELWGVITDPSPNVGLLDPQIEVVGATSPRLMVVYQRDYYIVTREIRLRTAPVADAQASWSAPVSVLEDATQNFRDHGFATDAAYADDYSVYVAARNTDGTGSDIWFTRSTDGGASFEPEYMIGEVGTDAGHLYSPAVSYGFGGHVHVAWWLYSASDPVEDAVFYRRASNRAAGGIADWNPTIELSPGDGSSVGSPALHASATSNEVVAAFPLGGYPQVAVSTDQGLSFGPATGVGGGSVTPGTLVQRPGSATWFLATGHVEGPTLFQAHASDLTDWTPLGSFEDPGHETNFFTPPAIALDPSRSNRPAGAWKMLPGVGEPATVLFDAMWFGDPGVPNLEPGFPVTHSIDDPTSPALVDLDGDGDVEIVFTAYEQVSVLDHDGTPFAGWPINLHDSPADGPVAVGDLDGDGEPEIVVGTEGGAAYAFDIHGSVEDGWPVDIGSAGLPVYVSIGALGGPFPRTVVCATDRIVQFRDYRGRVPDGAYNRTFGAGGQINAPATIGDIDDDGTVEVVCAYHTAVHAFEMRSQTLDFSASTGSIVADQPTLVDVDLDGRYEIFIPGWDGLLHGLGHDGTPLGGGFPFDTGTFPLLSVAAATLTGDAEAEIVVANQKNELWALDGAGDVLSGFPVDGGIQTPLAAMPLIDVLEGSQGDIVLGSRDGTFDAWNDRGSPLFGWPEPIASVAVNSPALGDIDADGNLELVAITSDEIYVWDLGTPVASPRLTWTMDGHDPRRSGCSDCPEDVATGVTDDPAAVTRVAFAAPGPNPAAGVVSFRFVIPSPAVVRLDVFDLRGARVATVLREEIGAGAGAATWNGRDHRGRELPSGQYVARLRVQGPDVNEEVARKITILR